MQQRQIRHVHVSFSGTVAYLAAQCFPITYSLGVYGFGELYDPRGSSLPDKIRRAVFLRSVSRHGVNELMLSSQPCDWDKLEYVPLGIDLAQFPPRPAPAEGRIQLITVGRLSPEKGQDLRRRKNGRRAPCSIAISSYPPC